MTLLCMLWGFQQVTIKVAAPDVSLVMQAGIRSIIATALLLVWARARGIALFDRDGTGASGIAAGLLFAFEFVFIYGGLAHTTASRMIVFVYTVPCLTALMLPWFVRGERLGARQWIGVLAAFGGIVAAYAETLAGDLVGVIAAFLWAATIVLIRATRLGHAPATKTLFYQLAVSALVLPAVSVALGEPGFARFTPLAAAILAYQGAIVAFASYLGWFWLLRTYLAARLSVLSFLTPLFGVLFGALFLGERVTPVFLAAAVAVAGGIALVNLPQRATR